MVSYKGRLSSRPYEEIGYGLLMLKERTKEYEQHLDKLAGDIFKRFKDLKEDHDNGFINTGVYIDFLRILKEYLDTNPQPHQSLKVEEILKAINDAGLQ